MFGLLFVDTVACISRQVRLLGSLVYLTKKSIMVRL